MMRQGYNIILYSLVGLLLAAGLLLFLFQARIFDYLLAGMDLGDPLATSTITVPARDTLDPEVLQAPRFTALTNYVVNFDFDNICWRPDATPNRLIARTPASVATGTEIATGTESAVGAAAVPATLDCRIGNDLPFQAKKE
ncbi:MAG: hypothetical protein WC456_00770 [Patescibacteria group bacterium]